MTPPESEPHWTEPGAWPVATGVHRIPLPLPMDGLRAVNVYVLEGDDDTPILIATPDMDIAKHARKRVLVHIEPARLRSWDHTRLGGTY